MITEFSSQYAMRGQMADFSDIIRDSLAHRSNMLLSQKTTSGTYENISERAAKLYNDWENDVPSEWPTHVRKRNGNPYVFHKKIGKWVPTHSSFNFLPDIHDWISNNATTSSKDRQEFLNNWINMSRLIRMKAPYSYYPNDIQNNYAPGSVIIRNIDPTILDADLLMAFSVFGPIVDLHHPLHWKNKKRSFFVFIEYYNCESIDKLFAETDGVLHILGSPITIERAGNRKTSGDMKSKCEMNVSS
jgi:hypothetical protein